MNPCGSQAAQIVAEEFKARTKAQMIVEAVDTGKRERYIPGHDTIGAKSTRRQSDRNSAWRGDGPRGDARGEEPDRKRDHQAQRGRDETEGRRHRFRGDQVHRSDVGKRLSLFRSAERTGPTLQRNLKTFLPVLLLFLLGHFCIATPATLAQSAAAAPELRIGGAVPTPLVLTLADLKNMPRKTLSVTNPHDQKKETYEGVLLEDLLQKAGVTHGEHLRGAAMATYVLVEAEDGYRVIFSLAELDSGIVDSEVMVADTMDGAPLAAKQGPFRLVAPHEKRPARWVRMLKSITVVSVEGH
jgi:hypothetical protein